MTAAAAFPPAISNGCSSPASPGMEHQRLTAAGLRATAAWGCRLPAPLWKRRGAASTPRTASREAPASSSNCRCARTDKRERELGAGKNELQAGEKPRPHTKKGGGGHQAGKQLLN